MGPNLWVNNLYFTNARTNIPLYLSRHYSPMESKGQFSKFMVAFLLMVFIFALGNLFYNLTYLDLGGEAVPEFIEGSAAQDSSIVSGHTMVNALRWVYYGFLGFMILAVIIGAYSFSKSKDNKKWKNLFFQMMGYLAIIAVILGFAVFYEDIEYALSPGGSTDIVPGGTGSANSTLTAIADGPATAK